MKLPVLSATSRIVLIYAVTAVAWIFGSDIVMVSLASDSTHLATISIFKGLLFVLFSSVMFWAVLYRELRHRERVTEAHRVEQQQTAEQLRHQNAELLALHDVALSLINRYDPASLLEAIVARACDLVDTPHAILYLVESGDTVLVARVTSGAFKDRSGYRLEPNQGMAGHVWVTGRPFVVDSYVSWEGRVPNFTSIPIHAVVTVPLLSADRVLGVLGLARTTPGHTFGEHEIAQITRFGRLAALALENTRLYRGMDRRLTELATLQEIARVINSSVQLDDVFQVVVTQINQAFGYQLVSIYLCEPEGLVLKAYIGYDAVMPLIRYDQGVSGRVARTGIGAFVHASGNDSDFIVVAPNTDQAIIVPLKHADSVTGVLLVESAGNPILTEDDWQLLSLLADQISVAIRNARLFAELRTSEQRYRLLVETAASMIICLAPNREILEFNQEAERISGWRRDEVLGCDYFALFLPDQEQERVQADIDAVLNGQVTRGFENAIRTRSGQQCTILWNVTRLPAADPDSYLILAVGQDITARKILEEQYLQSQKMESIGRLAGGMAHDFNNVLTAILGYATLAQSTITDDSPVSDDLREIQQAAERAHSLTSQLLAFARRQPIKPVLLALDQLVGSLEKMLRRLLGAHLVLETIIEADLALIRADRVQIEQVLVNLAINARDAMPHGGRLTIGVQNVHLPHGDLQQVLGIAPGPYVLLTVADTGMGIPPEILPHIFEPFFTTKEPGKGTGLGLSICYGIIKQHNGAIQAESSVGAGTRFSIYLPQDGDLPSSVQGAGRQSTLPIGSETILLVEDEPAVRDVTARMLRARGYTVIDVPDGISAMDVLVQQSPRIDLLLTDVVMPRMSGTVLAERARSIFPKLQVLLMSGYLEERVIDDPGEAARVLECIQKPFTAELLVRRVRTLLDRKW